MRLGQDVLSNLEAFSANAFFTAGMMLFEVPTGIVADTTGRRRSFLLGTVTLGLSPLLYVMLWQIEAAFVWWAVVSVLIGLGFTFFSGAVEAWLVDALNATGFTGELEAVFGKGQIVGGAAMLVGSVAGGFIAQRTNLGVPFVLRGLILIGMFVIAFKLMHDIGFTPRKGASVRAEVRQLASATIRHGWRVPAVKWLMLSSLPLGGIGIYVFYALQPYLLELYGDPNAYGVAGLAAAFVAGAQIAGGAFVPWFRRFFRLRTDALILAGALSALFLVLIGLTSSFILALALLAAWCISAAVATPLRSAYVNGVIPSEQRATVLSFDALIGSGGGVVLQPVLGRSADQARDLAASIEALGSQALLVAADVTRPDEADRAMEQTVASFGRLDIIVNAVGGGAGTALASPSR